MPDERRKRSNDESRLLALAIRIGINAAALWLASQWVPGFDINGWQSILATATIFAVVNAVIAPVAQLLGAPISCVTMGIFVLVINAAMLGLAVWIAAAFDVNVDVDGVWGVFVAALLISFVSWLLNLFVGKPLKRALR
ncbi:MAG: phage holin family protein [Dehalococcoidia bacterium]